MSIEKELPPAAAADPAPVSGLGDRVRSAVIWRSGTQILSQLVSWGSTLAVVRILDPSDYGLFAMTSVVLVFLNFMNGYGFASAIIQAEKVEPIRIRQAFGMLLLTNAGLAAIQLTIAPLAAAYYGQPEIAALLRWQSLIYLATPFLVLPEALLSRELDFRRTAIATLVSTLLGAAVAIGTALSGWGVWTLVAAPIFIFWSRAAVLCAVTRFAYLPSFDFRGAGSIFGFGISLLASHGFWVVQSQSDIFIAGRTLAPHNLGIYAEALFLTQIFATRFVPPLNEVAFPAYSRLQRDPAALADAFAKAARMVLLVAFPLYFGLAVTAEWAVLTLFGPKWAEMVPLVRLLSLAMPVLTLQILFAPALNAVGRPDRTFRVSLAGAVIMTGCFAIGAQWGEMGLAMGWLAGTPLLLMAAARLGGAARRSCRPRNGRGGPSAGHGAARRNVGAFALRAAGGGGGHDLRRAALDFRPGNDARRAGDGPATAGRDKPAGIADRDADGRRGSGRADIVLQRLGFRLDMVDARLHQIADRDKAPQPAGFHHGQVADAPPGHQRQRIEQRGFRRHRYGRRGHRAFHRPVEQCITVLRNAVDHVALRKDPQHRQCVHFAGDDRHGTDPMLRQQGDRFANRGVRRDSDDSIAPDEQFGDSHGSPPVRRWGKCRLAALRTLG